MGSNLEQAEKKDNAIHSQGHKELNMPPKSAFPSARQRWHARQGPLRRGVWVRVTSWTTDPPGTGGSVHWATDSVRALPSSETSASEEQSASALLTDGSINRSEPPTLLKRREVNK